MIRKLRTKLVAAAMLSLLAVLTVILGVILLTNYRGIVSDADRILDLLADNQGKFPEIKADFDWEELGPRHRSVELGYETRYFSVLLDRQGTVLATDTGKIAAVDEETAASYAQAGQSTGILAGLPVFGGAGGGEHAGDFPGLRRPPVYLSQHVGDQPLGGGVGAAGGASAASAAVPADH